MATATADSLSPAAREFLERGAAHHHIGGERAESAGGQTFETIDPATAEAILPVAHGGPEDVDRAVEAARDAFEGAWAKVSPSKRTGMMLALADHNVIVPTQRTDRAQELHLCIEHIICDLVERELT